MILRHFFSYGFQVTFHSRYFPYEWSPFNNLSTHHNLGKLQNSSNAPHQRGSGHAGVRQSQSVFVINTFLFRICVELDKQFTMSYSLHERNLFQFELFVNNLLFSI